MRIAKDDTLVYEDVDKPAAIGFAQCDRPQGAAIDIVCPADRAPEWILPIASADALAGDYFTHANGGRSLQ